ncbi:MAG: hypothetical protein IPK96_14315 [Flammeovirgaceae bacterium]|nr:hypothetical protein [Flammeovirgaceae bacterium]
MAGMRAAFSLAFLNFVQQRLTRTKLLRPATSYAQTLCASHFNKMTDYELEKWIWTEKDIEKMGCHDATIYGLRLNENLELDIDYIFSVEPTGH